MDDPGPNEERSIRRAVQPRTFPCPKRARFVRRPVHARPSSGIDATAAIFGRGGGAFLRQQRGLSQAKLAAEAGIPVGTLRCWEYGRRTPLLDAAARVALALGVTLDELAGIDQPEGKAKKGK